MITLREITPDNWLTCIGLSVREGQRDFVASNVFSLAQAKVFPSCVPLAIYRDEEMVGFAMYGIDPEDGEMWISRLMIDQKHQGCGYGKLAMLQLLDMFRQDTACHAVFLSFEPENTGAEALYTALGFEPTGQIIEGERVMKLRCQGKLPV